MTLACPGRDGMVACVDLSAVATRRCEDFMRLREHDFWLFRNRKRSWVLSGGVDPIRIPDRCGLGRFVQPNRTACADSGDRDFDREREHPRRLPPRYAWNRDPSQLSATNQPARNRWRAQSAANPTRLLCAAPPLRSLLRVSGSPPSLTARIVSAVSSGRPPSAERPTHPKRSCFTGPGREATALTARGGHVVFRLAPLRGGDWQDSEQLARPDSPGLRTKSCDSPSSSASSGNPRVSTARTRGEAAVP